MNRKDRVLGFISDENYKPMKINEIAMMLCVGKDDRSEFRAIISELESEGKIYRNSSGKYSLPSSCNMIKGTYYRKSKKFGFIVDENDIEYYVPSSQANNAFNKDIVLARVTKKSDSPEKCSECSIVKILSHGCTTVVGTFIKNKNFGFVCPDDKAYDSDIYISKKHSAGFKDGQKVVVQITVWPEKDKNAEGYIIETLGFAGEKDVDVKTVLRMHSIDEKFPEKAELSAEAFDECVHESETEGRIDFRNNTVFTIDGSDSKDFDDAVGIEKTKSGYRLGVHIADVSYYVSENSALDIEARKRGTSVYLPGYVVPMLPPKLSNGICSLNPECDRLTLSVIMDFDSKFNLTDHKICESVIRSKHRLTYDEVTGYLENGSDKNKAFNIIGEDIKLMCTLAKGLKSKRLSKGSIDFDFPESKLVLDENGNVTDIFKSRSTISHQIIEEFMLAANTCVAEEMFWCSIPFIYRIHEAPSADKIKNFKKFLAQFGYKLNINSDKPMPGVYSQFYESIRGDKREMLISKVMLRSLMKAKYSEDNAGHFGLAFNYYCHFTSPIRRYPDLTIHRIIKEYINGQLTEKRIRYLSEFVKFAAKSSSEAELKAIEAERDAYDMKKAEYMSHRIGRVYPAIISSITSFGIFAETEFGVEGLISMVDLDDDYYIFDETNLTLTGKNTGKTYNIGDTVNIEVKSAHPGLRQIDYILERSEINE